MVFQSSIFNYFFVENCRLCHQMIAPHFLHKFLCICQQCFTKLSHPYSLVDSLPLEKDIALTVISALPYDKSCHTLLHRFKYSQDKLLSQDFALLMKTSMQQVLRNIDENYFADKHTNQNNKIIIVPIPLFWLRELQRGFNQSALLANILAKKFNLQASSNALKRTHHTKAQHSLNKEERARNIQGVFQANHKLVAGKTIILIDDLCTSGSTLKEAAKELLVKGASQVTALTLLRALLANNSL